MPTRTVKSRLRKPVKKKSRKPKKKSRKPKKKSRKSKSKFKVRKDRVFKKHGKIGAGKKLKKIKKVPSLVELAAHATPHTSEWPTEGDNLLSHLKHWVAMKPQQERLKRIMGDDLIKEISLRGEATFPHETLDIPIKTIDPKGYIKPLSEREIERLMLSLDDPNQCGEDMNRIYSTLKNLQKIPGDHIPNRFFRSYADRRRENRAWYMGNLRENLQRVKDDIDKSRKDYYRAHQSLFTGPFVFERDYTYKDKDGNKFTGSAAARSYRQYLDHLSLKDYKRDLAITDYYRNDLANYAHSLVSALKLDGDDDWIMDDFGDPDVDERYYHYPWREWEECE